MRLLLVEDDVQMSEALTRAFTRKGAEVLPALDGFRALTLWRECAPDVVVLDLTLPGMDGLHVLQKARSEGLLAPVLIVTARGTVGDRVLGLNTGADDYLPKPFDLDELEARVAALLRRAHADASGVLCCGALRFERATGAFYKGDEALEVTPREAAFLKALIAKPGHAVPKERLFRLVFPFDEQVQFEAIEVVAYRLRKKLSDCGVHLMTLRGLGYLIKPE
jgi:two-component system, OmpR family, response regulator TctD